MSTKSPKIQSSPHGQPKSPDSYLVQEYTRWKLQLEYQPTLVRNYLEAQARLVADALVQQQSQLAFQLPDRVVDNPKSHNAALQAEQVFQVPAELRSQMVGGLFDRLTRTGLNFALRQRLDELEVHPNQAVAISASLVRCATALHMVHHMLPAGRTVRYQALEGEEIPSMPILHTDEPASALLEKTDAVVIEDNGKQGKSRGDVQVPFVPAALRFFLPQWVAFDDQDKLLVASVNEAEAYLGSMQRFLRILHTSVSIATYMVADEQYQQKRYGMLGQLVNQGRALARYETQQIIDTIRSRATAHDLNRGLSLSLPYFDDQSLEMRMYEFQVIPAGRIMFTPGFVVRACRQEEAKVAQDTRLDPSTRRHLLVEFQALEHAFDTSDKNPK